MEIDKLTKQLRLLESLVGNELKTKEQLCKEHEITLRTFYRYVALFKEAGFHVTSRSGIFCVQPSSPFVQRLTEHMRLTVSEQNTIHDLLEQANGRDKAVQNLKARMRDMFGMKFNTDTTEDKNVALNTDRLMKAIAEKRVVVLHEYYSPHSQTTTDRRVEPFKFLRGTREIRCYEPDSGMCKTFKVSRIKKEVELTEEAWQNELQHRTYYTDMFGFSGETTYRVKLKLGYLSANLLMEEYGVHDYEMVVVDEKHWLYSMRVCSFQGVGRFVQGLLEDIEVVDSNDFKQYLLRNLQTLTKKLKNGENSPGL